MTETNPDLIAAIYRNSLLKFAVRAMTILEPGTVLKTGQHHEAISYAITGAFAGKHNHVVINQPPNTLKTHLVSISSVAWLLIKHPEFKFAIICHDEVLASKIVRSIRQIIKSEWYQALAPGTKIGGEKDTETVFETTAGGEVRAFSINGGITGHGFDVIIIDDPQKASTAHSETERKNVENAYSTAIVNRWRDPAKGVLIVVMQRLHVDDFTNYILKVHKGALHLSLPAKASKTISFNVDETHQFQMEAGQLLEPDRLTEAVLEYMRIAQGNDHFEAQYLQNPQMSAGRIIKPEWLRTFSHPRKADYKVISIDPAFTKDGGAYSAAIVANLVGQDVEITHAEQHQFDVPSMLHWIARLNVIHQPDLLLIETIGPGVGIPYHLRRFDSIENILSIANHSGKSKIERMEMVSPHIEAGRLWLPEKAPWRASFEKILTEFPYGSSADWPDCVSQLLLYFETVQREARRHHDRMHPPPPAPGERRKSMYYQRHEIFCDPI
jgi:hypothetical protein